MRLIDPSHIQSPKELESHDIIMWHDAFYQFAPVPEVEKAVLGLRELTQGLVGSILVAPEGVNGMLAGAKDELDDFWARAEHDERLQGALTDITVKRTECRTVPFHRMKVRPRKEIVPLGVEGVNAIDQTGVNVAPEAWRELIRRDDVVLIDNRNSFEYRLGRFKRAIDPEVGNFRNFPEYLEAHLPQWQAEGKTIAMYCTGGIRCEKTSAWLLDRGITTYQLEGGILNYFAQMPDADEDWQGECFVFDKRIALDTRLHETETRIEDVYDPNHDEPWRLQRAKHLQYGPEPDSDEEAK